MRAQRAASASSRRAVGGLASCREVEPAASALEVAGALAEGRRAAAASLPPAPAAPPFCVRSVQILFSK